MRALVVAAMALTSCARAPAPAPPRVAGEVSFRVLGEKTNITYCVEGPLFAVAADEAAWVDVFDRQTDCLSDPEIDLPRVRFEREIAVAAWWKVAPCLGHSVATQSVRREGDHVVVRAVTRSPSSGSACATATASLESFLALRRSALYDGSQPVAFVLDGREVGRAAPRT